MKVKSLYFVSLVILHIFLVGSAGAAAGPNEESIRFDGYTKMNGEMHFSLSTVENGLLVGVKWIPVGGTYRGYSVDSFDKTRHVLVLTREGRRRELPLQEETFIQPNAAMEPFSREAAVDFISSLVRDIIARTRGYLTYEDLPPDIYGTLTGKIRDAIDLQKAAMEKTGGTIHVVNSIEDTPLVLTSKGLEWDKLPRGAGKVLTDTDKADLNAQYVKASIHHSYIVALSHALAGNIERPTGPGQGRRVTLPPGIAPPEGK